MEKRGDKATHIETWLQSLGYSPDTSMRGMIGVWWGWLLADNSWYHYSERRGFRVYKRERVSLHPAALVADEWASLLMTEGTVISSSNPDRAEWMARHFPNPDTGSQTDEGKPTEDIEEPQSFAMDNADFISRAFALGTGAWVIEPHGVTENATTPDAELRIVEYDATQIYPLTYSTKGCTQCAFSGRVEVGGKAYDQCQAHVIIDGEYHILTQLFGDNGQKVEVESIIGDFNTHCKRPLFSLVTPGVPNHHRAYSAMGASVYQNALGAIKTTDEALTGFLDHMRVGRPKTFIDDTLIESKTEKDKKTGETVKTYYAFGEADDCVFRMRPGDEGGKKIDVVQTDLKVDELTEAINTGLRMLSLTCGFGNARFSWDAHTGLKTAKEVSADNSMLMNSIKKHTNSLRKSIVRLVNGMAEACRKIRGENVPYGDVTVTFDDSIVTDTTSAREMAMSEVGAGIMQAWEYRKRFYGESEEDAKAALVDASMQEPGPDPFDMLDDGLS